MVVAVATVRGIEMREQLAELIRRIAEYGATMADAGLAARHNRRSEAESRALVAYRDVMGIMDNLYDLSYQLPE